MPKIYLTNSSAQAQKIWYFDEKRLHWVSLVRSIGDTNDTTTHLLISKLFHASIVADKWIFDFNAINIGAKAFLKL